MRRAVPGEPWQMMDDELREGDLLVILGPDETVTRIELASRD